MNAWKTIVSIAVVLAIVAGGVTLTTLVEFTAPGLFIFTIGMGFGAFVVWDQVLMKGVSTMEEIVEKGNIAYALFMLIPALIVLAGALAMQG